MLNHRTYYLNDYTPWVTLIHGAGTNSSIWSKQLFDYTKIFNVLIIDLGGHGKPKKNLWEQGVLLSQIGEDVMEVLDYLQIQKTHFIGISLGTIVIQAIAQRHPERVQSMVLGGAVTKLNIWTNLLINIGNLTKRILPYMWLYSLFTWIVMPRKNHAESRQNLMKMAEKIPQEEFIKWFSVTRRVNPFIKSLQKDFLGIPTLFIMGEEDYLFKDNVELLVLTTNDTSLVYIENAGHVCNIEQSRKFNQASIDFIYRNGNLILPLQW